MPSKSSSMPSQRRRKLRLRYVAGLVANNGAYYPSVEEYYSSLESRFGYWLLLGNARHCALRAMEEKLYTRLDTKDGSVLDAGAGSGYVAMYMARKGLDVQAVDITPHHIVDARKNVHKHHLDDKVQVEYGNYHNLTYPDASFNGIYTMETFVHADDPLKVLQGFYRMLKPGGVLVLHEADFSRNSEVLQDVLRLSHCQNTLEEGGYERLLEEAGFTDYSLEDLTDEVLPMWRLFGIVGYVPYQMFRLLGIQHRFTNVIAGVEAYLNWGDGRYISVRAVKP
ncbi:S-adenosyl-L-methionine-dependent methyltransferase [Lophiostoma macrostomum CBS 122681]|uniref:S-adenosyl-L-methionine-dependent methyltransferase n=1 Tax=Lophiostoma macrostomum CBS 122681 TaxID=1314788 RepID=A0A6A6SYW8_9PLEO|nr:S-adenosyl-L-methionine-dependent methyltransferase [Lophiostoma macrostomum CBS 122681]